MYSKSFIFLIVTVLVISTFDSCIKQNEEVKKPDPFISKSLEGSWALVSYVEDTAPGWKSYGKDIVYQKHITPTHFTWIRYNIVTDVLEGAGGGTYKYDGSTYTEYIDFFHPPGSSLVGQAIPFDVELENDIWFHTGYSKQLEFDPESGELTITDTTKIEEQWKKIKDGNEASELVNTWKLTGYKIQTSDSVFHKYTGFVGYLKLITPTHFTWVKYNMGMDGNEVLGLGSGLWEVNGDTYTESIQVLHPSGSNQVNTVIDFHLDIKDSLWYHSGYITRIGADQILLDSGLVDEVWTVIPPSQQ